MTEQQIYRRVRKIVAETLRITELELLPGSRITEDLHADSMQVVTILIALDAEFDTEFRLEDIPHQIVTLKWISEFVELTIAADRTSRV
jgi:acyl carrier protein